MRKVLAAFAALACTAVVAVSPAGAITGNFEKDFIHDYVGLIAYYDANGKFLHRCSGALINPTTFLTAGHCSDVADPNVDHAIIWFSQSGGSTYNPATGEAAVTGYPYSCIDTAQYPCRTASTLLNNGFTGLRGIGQDNLDVGMAILDQPLYLSRYGSLADVGFLDSVAAQTGKNATFTATGYGISETQPATISYRERLMATLQLVNIGSAYEGGTNLHLSTNPGGGKGGTCFGDSGGPILYDSTDIIVGVNSFVKNLNCAGSAFAYRTDTAETLNWILANADYTYGGITVVSYDGTTRVVTSPPS
ncbi:MAG: trypsin-like serine protease [Actinobacteria bacterium]|nr:trypsin-like serine protease [Actinomycetota bacterium]